MGFWDRIRSAFRGSPRAAVQEKGGGRLITTSDELEKAISAAVNSASGQAVTPDSAMRVAAVYACIRLRTSAVGNLPLHMMDRVDENTRKEASNHPLEKIFRRRPNRWQTPSQFKRMMEAHLLLRGNAYALIVRSRGRIMELVPLNPDRVKCEQNDDLSLSYVYTRKDGRQIPLSQSEVFHLVGLTLDGVHGVSAIAYAREAIGLSLAMENHGANTFKNGARPSLVLRHPSKLGKEGLDFLKASLEEYRAGGESDGKALILEEGMDTSKLSMTAEDAQWIESRKFSRTDIAMFFGVPPHMIGDTEKSTSWGSGIEQQSIGFVTYTLEESLTTWEETINRSLLSETEDSIYARFNRAALVRGDLKTRYEAYQIGRQIKVLSANDVRRAEDMNPVDNGDVYENPAISTNNNGDANVSPQPA